MAKNTDRYGKPIKSVTLDEAIDELLSWDKQSLIVLSAMLMVTHHAEEFEDLVSKIKKELVNGKQDKISINH